MQNKASGYPNWAHKAQQRIIELKTYLSQTDYICMKLAEGAASPEEYADVIKQREAAREEIRELEPIVES